MAWLHVCKTEHKDGSRFTTVVVRDWDFYHILLVPKKFVKDMQLKVKILKRQGSWVKVKFPKKRLKGPKVLWCSGFDVEEQWSDLKSIN